MVAFQKPGASAVFHSVFMVLCCACYWPFQSVAPLVPLIVYPAPSPFFSASGWKYVDDDEEVGGHRAKDDEDDGDEKMNEI